MTEAARPTRGRRKTKTGRVVSDKMDKTIVVSVERLARHRLYKRVIRLTTKFKAHDELNEANLGDTVLIEESRPLSATKRWRLVQVLARGGEHGSPGDTLIEEEAEVSEAIHAAAHPGRTRAETGSNDAADAADAAGAGAIDAAGDEAGHAASGPDAAEASPGPQPAEDDA